MGKLRYFFSTLFGGSSGEGPDIYDIPPPAFDLAFRRSFDAIEVQVRSESPPDTGTYSSVPAGVVTAKTRSRKKLPGVPPWRTPETDGSSAVGLPPGPRPQHSPNVLDVQSATSSNSRSATVTATRDKQLPPIPPQWAPATNNAYELRMISELSEEVTPVVQTRETSKHDTPDNSMRFPVDSNELITPPNQRIGGILAGAQGVVINKSTMTEVHQHHGLNALERMARHIIPGAEFDSSNRDDPPRCHPDTRTRFLEQLQTRIHDSTLGTRIIWLVGPAGVGKSAIMQSLAEIVCPDPTLRCATLFFSRPNHRDDPKKVFTTLGYDFAVTDEGYRRYMGGKLSVDPGFLDKSLDEQFKRLFVIPFTTGGVRFGSRRWVVLLDGFDEINGERGQCRILDMIRESLLPHIQNTPFIWIIASRPEAHLQASFHLLAGQIRCFWTLEVPIDSEEALRSVETYLREEFTKIRQNYPDVVPSFWPPESAFLVLTRASSGLFIFASTVVDYIGKENPVVRLKDITSLIDQSAMNRRDSLHKAKRNPFHALDILYTMIMSEVPLDSLPTTKTILGFYLLGDAVWRSESSPDLIVVCNVLGIEQHTAYAALRKLHSVLTFPSPDKAREEPVKFLHASFSDFLKDRSRSQSYYVDLDQELMKIWRCYANIVKVAPVKALRGRIMLSWEPLSTVEEKRLRNFIQRRAQMLWFRILIRFCHDSSCQYEEIRHRLSPDTAEVVEVFEKLGSELFERLGSESHEDDIAALCGWLSYHAPVTFRQTMIFKEYNLMQLGEHDMDCMFRGLYIRKSAFYYLRDHSFSNPMWFPQRFGLENLGVEQWNQAKQLALDQTISVSRENRRLNWSVLAKLLVLQRRPNVESRNAKVTIMRTKPTQYYAVVGPIRLPVSSGINLEYLVFPYVEK